MSLFLIFSTCAFLLSLLMLGPSAAFVIALSLYLYWRVRRYSSFYLKEILPRDLNAPSGSMRGDLAKLQGKIIPLPINIYYYTHVILPLAIYCLLIVLLSHNYKDTFSYFVKINENFIEVSSLIFPTIDTHYNAVAPLDLARADLLRQLYVVCFFALITFTLSFLPIANAISAYVARLALKYNEFSFRYIRGPFCVVVLLPLTLTFFHMVLAASVSGGSEGFIFFKYGRYDVTENDHFFLLLYLAILIPYLVVTLTTIILSQLKFFLLRNKNHV